MDDPYIPNLIEYGFPEFKPGAQDKPACTRRLAQLLFHIEEISSTEETPIKTIRVSEDPLHIVSHLTLEHIAKIVAFLEANKNGRYDLRDELEKLLNHIFFSPDLSEVLPMVRAKINEAYKDKVKRLRKNLADDDRAPQKKRTDQKELDTLTSKLVPELKKKSKYSLNVFLYLLMKNKKEYILCIKIHGFSS